MTGLPKGWEILPLSELVDNAKIDIVDGPFGSNLKRSDFHTSGVPVLKIQNIKPNKIQIKNMDYVTPLKAASLGRHSFVPGDIIMTKLGAPLGVSAIVGAELPEGVIVADLVRIRPGRVNAKFLCYQLNSPGISKFINDSQKGTTRPRINIQIVRNLPIAVPSLEEQNRIVETLDENLARLDKALAETQNAAAKATTYWHSMLHSLLFKDGSGNFAPTVALGSLADLVMGQAPAGTECNKNGVGTPFVKVGEFGITSPEIREWTTKPLKMASALDVLICVVGATVGKLNLGIDCAIGRSVAAIRPGLQLRQKYLFYFLQTKVLEIRSSSKGSAQGVITRQQLLEMPIPDLPLETQDRLIQYLETAKFSLDQALSDLTKVSSSTGTLRRSVLNAAFTGQLLTTGNEIQ